MYWEWTPEQLEAWAAQYHANQPRGQRAPNNPQGGDGTPKSGRDRCFLCDRRVGFQSGMILLIRSTKYAHIKCVSKKLDELEEQGKLEDIQEDK